MNRAVLLLACCACAGDPDTHAAAKRAYPRGLIVLGIDGMDPKITRELLAAGQLPNLAALLARGGTFGELDTTMPPQSPVAWSTIITGEDLGGHGIYDFVHRDPQDVTPYLSTSRTEPPNHVIELGSYAFPLDSAKVELMREGRAFWQDLEDAGVPATVVKIPANFPPAPSKAAESSSGMGTPDLLGTYGTFQVFTDDPQLQAPLKSGIVHRLEWAGQRARSTMSGPPNPIRAALEPMDLPVEIVRDAKRDVALVRLGDRDVILTPGEWSDWIPIAFDPGLLGGDVHGMVRLYLRGLRPTFHLYASPMNIDPLSPAMPVSSPPDYAAALAHDVGRSYTQGMPEDTKALASGVLSPPEFLTMVGHVMDETWAALDRELGRFHGGLLFVYLSSIDQTSHVFFRSLDPEAPPEERAYADAIPALYRQVDGWLGKVIARAPSGTEVLVMSDHGFTHYRTKVHLNSFLAHQGYLAGLPEDQRQPGSLGHIDWSRTQAYALGLNEVFVNLAGREAHGIVSPAEKRRGPC